MPNEFDKTYPRIASFYSDPDFPEGGALTLDDHKKLAYDIDQYHKTILAAVEAAKEKYLGEWLHRNLLYSRTWT